MRTHTIRNSLSANVEKARMDPAHLEARLHLLERKLRRVGAALGVSESARDER